jgi:mono/diheme cytochrome c family protein
MMTRLLLLGAFVLTFSMALIAQVRPHDLEWAAPAKHSAKTNPLDARQETIRGGAKIFLERCAQCHGEDARGTDKAPNLADTEVQTQSDGALFWKITTGNSRSGMPTFSFLPVTQRWQLVLFLRTLGK